MLSKIITTTLATVITASSAVAASRAVTFAAPDGVIVAATYTPVARTPAPAVVLVHGLGETRDAWSPLTGLLEKAGIATLAIDLRGHGESVRKLTTEGPLALNYREFRPIDFQDMMFDVNAGVDWLLEQPGVDKNRIAIVGASIGGNIVLRYATVNDDLAAIVVLSPGIVYRDVRADDVIGKIPNRPLRLLVAQNDAFAFESCKRLMEIRKELGQASDQSEMKACAGNLHGTDLVRGVQGLADWLADWLALALSVSSPAPSPPPPPAK